jgi:starch-binding outer membrane protein, SusD/RagB family
MKLIIRKKLILMLALIVVCWLGIGCKKYLDEKSNKSFAVPDKVSDLQALLDYFPAMNNKDAGSGEVSSNDYYLLDATWAALSTQYSKDMYTWQKDNLFAPAFNDWQTAYQAIYTANSVLDDLTTIDRNQSNSVQWDNVKAEALVFRSKFFLQTAAIWSLAYNSQTAQTDLGIPLRLNSDFNEVSVRASVLATYDQIITDLKRAAPLLPIVPLTVLRPSKPAAYGLLARTYLDMGDYVHAGLYADSCLQLYNQLINYSTLNPAATYPIAKLNPEVIFESYISTPSPVNPSRARIDSLLYSSYSGNDLRKIIFFRNNGNGSFAFKGSYEGGVLLFSGLATDEMYLTRAEANARQGNTANAMKDLNILLKSRWDSTFKNLTASTSNEALSLILTERRKELLMRGLRWMDLKRLNLEGGNITLTRTVNGQTYTLPPNDPRYALPLPDDLIGLSGMPQNPR